MAELAGRGCWCTMLRSAAHWLASNCVKRLDFKVRVTAVARFSLPVSASNAPAAQKEN